MDSSAIAIVAQSQRRMQTDVEVTLLGKKLLLPVSRLISAEQQAHYVLLRFEDGATVDVNTLIEAGIVRNPRDGVKILGNGELTKKLTVQVDAFSKSAAEKIEALGGKAEVI